MQKPIPKRTVVAILAVALLSVLFSCKGHNVPTNLAPEPPQVHSHDGSATLTLAAVIDAHGRDAFSFEGETDPPVLRLWPGDKLKIKYVNELPKIAREPCLIGPCHDMTNLHFHGLGVSPDAPQDDVLDMMASPGQTLYYSVQVPADHPPGLYWYHTHPHGESYQQALDGMSGAIIIDGIDRYVPELRGLRERVLVLRAPSTERDPARAALNQRVEMSAACGAQTEQPERVFTVNGAIRPLVEMAPGAREFWRIVNASADRYMDLSVDGGKFEIVALDGVPLALHDPQHKFLTADHYLLPPAGRLEAVVSAPQAGARSVLRSSCVDTGPAGDPNNGMVMADIVTNTRNPDARVQTIPIDQHPPVYKQLDMAELTRRPVAFVATFTEDSKGFYINGQKFSADAAPLAKATVGTYQHWRIMNATTELHPMHLHQVHFYAYSQNGVPFANPAWLDTVNVPVYGFVDVIVDFTNPVIRGMAVFHCHLLNHEDKGMMAKILFQ
jgi:suppressor of ftsI